MICTNFVDFIDRTPAAIVEPCPRCGHALILHPGPANPALDGCAMCGLVEEREEHWHTAMERSERS